MGKAVKKKKPPVAKKKRKRHNEQLDRMEDTLQHVHEMLHEVVEGAVSPSDQAILDKLLARQARMAKRLSDLDAKTPPK